ncbi:HEPN domain-containing protein [Desulfacinum infernum DSM 9756]|uniref:HEPN domain-containing protein n=1 Tax=Desulfacinum infernum DSM 9756 TaxID=1121391 RepID=A0A1M4YGG9_9BACT|nr:HEPN domain-containing protein [Desulfacinum infernum]SHF04743.1 HEPN domain-containing protein [Desulfacinum infernum DSM 9756]
MGRALDWLRQAENDILWAEHSLQGGFYAQTCFISQQAGEKALKALCFHKGFEIIKTHSLYQIVTALKIDGELLERAKELDIYHVSGRYPDAFPAGAPFELLSAKQAEAALESARFILAWVQREMPAHE